MRLDTRRWLFGLWRLIRPVPVTGWGVAAPFVGLAAAIGEVGFANIDWGLLALAILVVVMIHGYLSHAINDQVDWQSGTDRHTEGVLSGGSKVLHRDLLSLSELSQIGVVALVASAALGIYVAAKAGFWVWPHLVIGIGAALAYSLPPLRLSYRPLLGEWLCALPALAAASSCTYYVAVGAVSWRVVLAGALHGVFCLGWLMEHHISDVPADLRATPRKVTTVAYVTQLWGSGAAPWVAASYFLLAIPLSISLWRHDSLRLVKSIPSITMALVAAAKAANTNPNSTADITLRERFLILITFAHVIWLGLALTNAFSWPTLIANFVVR
jgi:1,4-dihydroxy-2-naphthoate octaprenyltransferase